MKNILPTIDYNKIPSPCFVLDEHRLRANLSLIKKVKEEAGVEIIMAFKAFAMFPVFPIIKEYISKINIESIDKIERLIEDNKLIGIVLWNKKLLKNKKTFIIENLII